MLDTLKPYIETLSKLEAETTVLHQFHKQKLQDFLSSLQVSSLQELTKLYRPSKEFELLGSRVYSYKLLIDSSFTIIAGACAILKEKLAENAESIERYLNGKGTDEIKSYILKKAQLTSIVNELRVQKRELEIKNKYCTEIESSEYSIQMAEIKHSVQTNLAHIDEMVQEFRELDIHENLLAQYFEVAHTFEETENTLKIYQSTLVHFSEFLSTQVRDEDALKHVEDWGDELAGDFTNLSLSELPSEESETEEFDPFLGIDSFTASFTPSYTASIATQITSSPSSSCSSSSPPSTSDAHAVTVFRTTRTKSNSF